MPTHPLASWPWGGLGCLVKSLFRHTPYLTHTQVAALQGVELRVEVWSFSRPAAYGQKQRYCITSLFGFHNVQIFRGAHRIIAETRWTDMHHPASTAAIWRNCTPVSPREPVVDLCEEGLHESSVKTRQSFFHLA